MKFIGLDAGSVSVKLVVLDENRNKLHTHYERHRGRPLASALRLLKEIVGSEGGVGGQAGSNGPQAIDQFLPQLQASLLFVHKSLKVLAQTMF